MLVLTRKEGEKILIGDDIVVTVVRIAGNQVRMGIEAPKEVRVIRGELPDRVTRGELPARAAAETKAIYADGIKEVPEQPAAPPEIGKPAATPPLQVKKKP